MESKSRNKIVLVSDFGRSGQGWLSYMLCYILNAQFIEPYNFLNGKKYSVSEHILDLTQGNLPNRERTNYSLVVKTHNILRSQIDLTDKIILLVRDPRDVAVSMQNLVLINYNKIGWGHPRAKFFLLMEKSFRLLNYIKIILSWKRHYYSWKKSSYYFVRYEDLLVNCQQVLEKILKYLEIQLDEKIIKESFYRVGSCRHNCVERWLSCLGSNNGNCSHLSNSGR